MYDNNTILISCPVNGGADRIYDQILAYNQAVSNCVHVIHLSRDSLKNGFLEELDSSPYDFRKIDNVLISDHRLFSRRPTLLGIHVMNAEFAVRQRLNFGHVYLHTATDLPFRLGLGDHIRANDLALGKPKLTKAASAGGWDPAIRAHHAFQRLLADCGLDTIYTSRYEGFFATRGLFFEIMTFMMTHIPFDRDEVWRGNYPYEEFILPTIVEHLTAGRGLRRVRHPVKVGGGDKKLNLGRGEPFGEQNIPALLKMPAEIFSMKVAPPMTSALRPWVREQLGYSLPPAEAGSGVADALGVSAENA